MSEQERGCMYLQFAMLHNTMIGLAIVSAYTETQRPDANEVEKIIAKTAMALNMKAALDYGRELWEKTAA